MKLRHILPLTLVLPFASCGGDAAEEAPAAEEAAAPVSDEQALADLRTYWESHYNMHHASVVAGVYTEDAWSLPAAGGLLEGRAAIEADMENAMAASPTATITGIETMVLGDHAVSLGSYSVQVTPEGGEPMTMGGHYLNLTQKVDGEWKIAGGITNYDSARPEGWSWNEMSGDPPAEEGTMTEVTDYFVTHWNMNHPDMVADAYTDDAVVGFSNSGLVRGRSAVATALAERRPEGAELAIHDVGTMELGGGWALDGGWYEFTAADGGAQMQVGAYLNVMRQDADGSWKIHWGLTNSQPGSGM
jgi:uncharacterized protein (TIGR02246 family)